MHKSPWSRHELLRDDSGLQDKQYFQRIPPPKEDELDMLDMAFGLTDL